MGSEKGDGERYEIFKQIICTSQFGSSLINLAGDNAAVREESRELRTGNIDKVADQIYYAILFDEPI